MFHKGQVMISSSPHASIPEGANKIYSHHKMFIMSYLPPSCLQMSHKIPSSEAYSRDLEQEVSPNQRYGATNGVWGRLVVCKDDTKSH